MRRRIGKRSRCWIGRFGGKEAEDGIWVGGRSRGVDVDAGEVDWDRLGRKEMRFEG
jgi:hypothetical protein